MMTIRTSACFLVLLCLGPFHVATAQEPGQRPTGERAGQSILQRYQGLLQQAKNTGIDTSEAEALAEQSAVAMRNLDKYKADQLIRAAIEKLQAARSASQRPTGNRSARGAEPFRRSSLTGASQPVFVLPFTHHYNGPGGYYPGTDEVRKTGEFFIRAKIPGTMFFDGILVERLQKEDPSLIRQIREWNLPLGYHGEETHGPYPVASELLGEIYTLKEAQGYKDQWSLTTGKDWNTAVQLVEERYSFARPYRIDETTHMIDRRQPSATDRSRVGGLKLVQQAFCKDVSFLTSHSLESAPEGYAFRRMSKFGLDQPTVPVALHALKIFRIGEVADQIMRIAGDDESIFWYMSRLHCKGDENGETGHHLGPVRRNLEKLDRSRPRLLLMGFSKIVEEEAMETVQYLNNQFFPQNPGSCWVTGDTLVDQFEPEKAYRPTAADQSALARAITGGWQGRPPDLLTAENRVFSLADAFECLARALVQRDSSDKLPDTVELHALYGPIAEDGSPLLRQETTLPVTAIRTTARTILESMDRSTGDRFIPARLAVDSNILNGGEFLYAMAAALLAGPVDSVRVQPSQMFPPYADLLIAVFKPKAVQPVCYTQGQLWTVKPVRLKAAPAASATPVASTSSNALASTGALPKSTRVVFASNMDSEGGCHREDPSGADLYKVDFNLETKRASDLQRLTTRAGPEWFPALSPNGRYIVYDLATSARAGVPGKHDLWQYDLNGNREKLLVQGARFPAFDSTGKFLYYSPQLRGDHQLLRTSLQTGSDGFLQAGEPHLIADRSAGKELVEDPAPLPDNSAVVFHRKDGPQGAGVALIPTDGGPVQALTPFDGCGHAAISPDGQAVACTRSRDGRIVIIRRSGAGWQSPRDLQVSGNPLDYQDDDDRFKSVREVRHSYVEWITPKLMLVTAHGADGAREFRFARLYLLILKGDDQVPERIDLSAAIEKLAGKRNKDFCSGAAVPLLQ